MSTVSFRGMCGRGTHPARNPNEREEEEIDSDDGGAAYGLTSVMASTFTFAFGGRVTVASIREPSTGSE